MQVRDEISSVQEEDFDQVVQVWEDSVRATHHFLTEADIQYFKPLVRGKYLYLVTLAGVRDQAGEVVGFVGVAEEKIEMLFIDPAWRGKGIGRRLLNHAVERMGATLVDVNEQNEQAVGFYLRMGFEIERRSEVDGMGKPFPLLHMRLKK